MSRFFWRKISWSTCSDLRVLLCAVTMSPAVEKTLSAETLVPGMHRKPFASLDSSGYACSCSFHQLSGFSWRGKGFSSLNLLISAAAVSCADFGGMLFSEVANTVPSKSANAHDLLGLFMGSREVEAGPSSQSGRWSSTSFDWSVSITGHCTSSCCWKTSVHQTIICYSKLALTITTNNLRPNSSYCILLFCKWSKYYSK